RRHPALLRGHHRGGAPARLSAVRGARRRADGAGGMARARERGRPRLGSARGADGARAHAMTAPRVLRRASWRAGQHEGQKPTLATGAIGFIGTTLTHRLLEAGTPVLLFDNMSRRGVEANLAWLREMYGERVQMEVADVRDRVTLAQAVARASRVFHF